MVRDGNPAHQPHSIPKTCFRPPFEGQLALPRTPRKPPNSTSQRELRPIQQRRSPRRSPIRDRQNHPSQWFALGFCRLLRLRLGLLPSQTFHRFVTGEARALERSLEPLSRFLGSVL